jgi:serine/threonine protein kinase
MPSLCPHDATALVRSADLASAAIDPMVGQVIAGRFTVLSRLGEGAMGTVYRAKQSPIGREVAVKILRSERALDETSRGRFLREARANSLLTSPNTVTVFDFGTGDKGEFYLAMELLEGESLGQRLKRVGRLDAAAALDIARQALRSLAEAHEKGIIHRDLKPDNLFFSRLRSNETYEEIVKVLDFGIAKMLRDDEAIDAIETQAGTVFGTPRYMSPEQAQGKPLDARSDLYSLGVMLYQMLTGRPPFTDDDAIVVMARHIKTMPRPMSEVAPDANIPPEVESAVMRMLSKDPAKRPQTADAMSTELGRAKESALSVTSGIRASLSGAIETKHEVAAVSPANDTLDAPHSPQHLSSRTRWRWMLAGLVLAGLGGTAAVVLRGSREAHVAAPLVHAAQSEAVAAPAPSMPPAGAIVVHPEAPPVPSATTSAIAPRDSHAPTLSVTHAVPSSTGEARPLPSAHRHGAPTRSPGSAPPAGSAGSVGYGYLE